MKRKPIFFTLLSAGILLSGTLTYNKAFAVEAANCSFTSNSGDYCYTSDGSHNIKVLQCAPGSSSCSYDPPAN